MNHRLHIGISGSYGGLNLGDEAILQSIITQIKATLNAEITIFSRNVKDTKYRHRIERTHDVHKMILSEVTPEVEKLDILVIGGGGILYDADARMYLREALIAKEHNIPVMIYAIGAGPLNDPLIQECVRSSLEKVDLITVRDRQSRQILEDIGLRKEVIITADPALLLKPESVSNDDLINEGIFGKTRLIGMSVREAGVAAPNLQETNYHTLLANAADYMIERYDASILFIPMEPRESDFQQSHLVIAKMLHPQKTSILKGNYTSGQMLSIISKLEFAVGMRLHFLIFAAIQKIPFVALPYSSKIAGFLDDLQIEMPPIAKVNEGRLLAYIDKWWDQRKNLQLHISQRLPDLQQRAMLNNKLLIDLLNKYPKIIKSK
jgi:polysaccharide pyruvyl transferase CsaB